jgi:lysophospholipase L1-like esterase
MTCLALTATLLSLAQLKATDRFDLNNGDRVVLIGSTVIEREQVYGYWELALTCRFHDRNVTFRNLGWSGDTVWGEARAGFDPPAAGYKRLVEHTLALKPTVIFLCYGTNESFAGKAGLPAFEKQLNKLLDDLAPSQARIVMMAPPQIDKANWPAGNAKEREAALNLYTDAIRAIAKQRGAWLIKDICARFQGNELFVANGMHLSAYGYWRTSFALRSELNRKDGARLETFDLVGEEPSTKQAKQLRGPPPPSDYSGTDQAADCVVRVRDLKPGKYQLLIDDRAVHTADAKDWLKPQSGVNTTLIRKGPSLDQTEKLRRLIVEKNRLYFHRWRPQNETYLFGFRKHEQGKNAAEVPQFDQLIEKLEAQIAKLRVPVEHKYQLVEVK